MNKTGTFSISGIFSGMALAGLLLANPVIDRAWAQDSGAQDSGAQDKGSQNAPIVVELFSSQACSSCLSASEYFRKLAEMDGVVALGWHVDYWNMLNTPKGRWVDPFSSKEHTNRQKKYNVNIRHRSSIYTPQMVVGGANETVGSSRDKVEGLIKAAREEQPRASIDAEIIDGEILFRVSESAEGGNAYLVNFKRLIKTEIKGGENAGVDFLDANVVTNMKPLGVVRRIGGAFAAEMPPEGEGCAFLFQEPGQGRILAARYCPQ